MNIDCQGFSIDKSQIETAIENKSKITIVFNIDLASDPVFITPIPCYTADDGTLQTLKVSATKASPLEIDTVNGNQAVPFDILQLILSVKDLQSCSFHPAADNGNISFNLTTSPVPSATRSTNPSPPAIM